MPDFLTIQRQHEAAKLKGLIDENSSLADFAKLGALATNDPSYKEVADSPAWKNMIRSWSANADEAIQSGPVDDWTANAFGWAGDKFGVTPEVSRSAGRELPRQFLNFLPMMAGGTIGGLLGSPGGPAGIVAGAAKGGSIGLGLTSALSAFDAYGKSGKPLDAIIGAASPYVGSKLASMGTSAVLKSAATPGSLLSRAGFMKGKDFLNPATHLVTDPLTGVAKEVLGTSVEGATNKALGYLGGQVAANAGFTALNLAEQGPDAVLNKDYLFANLASNLAFAVGDIPRMRGVHFVAPPIDKPLVPTQEQINAEKTRGEVTQESLAAIDNSLARFQKEAELGVDIGRFIDKHNAVAATMEGHRAAVNLEAENFKSTWNKLREVNSGLPDVLTGIDPKELLQNPSVIGFDPAKAEVLRYAEALKQINKVKGGNLSRIAKSDADLNKVMGLVEEDLKLPDTLLNTPVEQRTVEQYQRALGTKLSDNAIKLIRMKHMEIAQGEKFVPEFPKLWEEYQKALTTGFSGSVDDRYELITASLLANGRFPKVVRAQKKVVKQVAVEGQTQNEAAETAIKAVQSVAKKDELAKAVEARMEAAKKAVGSSEEVFNRKRAESPEFSDQRGIDMPRFTDAVITRVEKALAVGAEVTLTTDGGKKVIPIVAVKQGMMRDAEGNGWGTLAAIADYKGEIKIKSKVSTKTPKLGRPTGPSKAMVDKTTAVEERITLAGKALKPTDEDRFFLIASQMIDPAHRAKGLSWMHKVATEHAPLPLAQKLLKFQAGLKTLDERVEASNQLKTVPLKEEVTPDAVAEIEAAMTRDEEIRVAASEEAMQELIVDEVSNELDEVPEISQSQQDQKLASDFMVALAKKAGVEISPADAARRFANMPLSVREKNLALAKQWKDKGFPQLATRDIDPLTIHFTTGQPLPIKEFATAWAREAGVPEAEIPAVVEDFVKITQYFAAGEARFGIIEGLDKNGAQFAQGFRPAVKLGDRVVEAPTHLQAWEKLFGKTYDKFGPAETVQMKDSVLKEGFITENGFRNRKEALTDFQAKGGKMNLTPGEKRDWLDSSDIRFARASAGAFDFGMREVLNGQIQRPGKPPLGTKDGWMQELDFRNNAGVHNGILQKAEVEFYKELVPEAFKDGKVHLQKLWDGLNKVGESVKVGVYGQENSVHPDKQKLDALHHSWWETLTQPIRDRLARGEFSGLNADTVAKYKEFDALRERDYRGEFDVKNSGPRATSYYNQISAKPKFKWTDNQGREWDSSPFRIDIVGTQGAEGPSDALHTPLGGRTYGWAMIQIIPDPKTNEPILFVGEQQSKWGQQAHKEGIKQGLPPARNFDAYATEKGLTEAQIEQAWESQRTDKPEQVFVDWQKEHEDRQADNYRRVQGHPLLDLQHALVLKAVIREAQKRGVKKVVVSDGESAMMTQEHDKAAEPSEIKIGPPIKLAGAGSQAIQKAGYKPTHQHFWSTDIWSKDGKLFKGYSTFDGTFVQEVQLGSPKPLQEGGMRLHYDTTLPSVMKKLTGSEGEMWDGGVHKNAQQWNRAETRGDNFNVLENDGSLWASFSTRAEAQAEVTRMNNAGNNFTLQDNRGQLGSPVFRNPDGTPKSSVTGRVYDISNPSDRVNTLFAQGGTIYGAAFKNLAQAYFSTKAFQGTGKTKAMSYVLAHEMGHIAFGKAMRGEYGPETKQLFDEAHAWVKTNDPQVLKDVEEVIHDLYLPKEFRNLNGVKDVLGNSDPEEWLANAHAMMVTGAVEARKPIKALLILPKPIREIVENTIRRIQDGLKSARMYWKLSGDSDKMNQVLRVKDMMDSVRRQFREAEWQKAQAMEFLNVDPAGLLDRMDNAQFARSIYGADTIKSKVGGFFNNAVQGLSDFMATYKSFQEPGLKLLHAERSIKGQVAESLTPIFGHQGATGNIVVDKSMPWFKLANSKPLYELVKKINLEAQDSNQSVIVQNQDGTISFNWAAMTPESRATVKLHTPENQKAMAQFLIQKEQSTKITQRDNVLHEEASARGMMANLLLKVKSFNDKATPEIRFQDARVVSGQIFDAIKSGDQAALQSVVSKFSNPSEAQKVITIAQEKAKKLDELTKFYADRPNFQSLRRFKPILQRYINPNGDKVMLDFNKAEEASAKRKELEAKGWKVEGDPIIRDLSKHKDEMTLDSKIVELLDTKEQKLKDTIASLDIDPEDRQALMEESSFLADVLRESKSNDIYLPGVKRRVSGGPEHLDMLEQHLTYTQAAHKAGYMKALGQEIRYFMNSPELVNQVREKQQFLEFYNQAKTPDLKFWRMVNKANAVWHIGWNLPGHLAELFQPIQTHIHEAVAQGHSMLTALRATVGAEKSAMAAVGKMIKSKIGYQDSEAIWEHWSDKDEADMLKTNWPRNLQQPLQEVYQQVGVNQETLRAIVEDREMPSPSKMLTKAANMYSNAAMGVYSVFTQHNALVGLLTGYRLAKKKGLSHAEAVKQAELFELAVNNSAGRLERPAYFNKLGGAGYMVYALSSYVRGRFSQLARYYRHGFDKVNFPELNQQDRRAARQAFASMIAGQLAAAGILGFPFVGAGIALMEDLTGDEIKGNGLKALNEITDDPLLTQAISYGVFSSMAESLGIPADLHSRFALGGFMGINSYDGVSAASVLGPTASMVNSMWKMGKTLTQEHDLNAAFRAGGPGGIKRMAEALSEDFQGQNPDVNLPMAMAGFRSGKMFKAKEMERIISKTNEAAQRDMQVAAKRVEESLLLGPQVAQATLMREASQLIDQKLEGRGRQLALRDMMNNLRQRIALQEVKKQMPSDLRGKATGQTASRISEIANAVGYQPPPAGTMEQEQIMRHVYSQLGGVRSPQSMLTARRRQSALEMNPIGFY